MNNELVMAINSDDIDDVKRLINQGVNINATIEDSNIDITGTPLHFAVEKKNKEIIKLLISKGSNINALDSFSMTPLIAAVSRHSSNPQQDYEIVQLLIARGADINATDKWGNPPLAWAPRNSEIEKILRKGGGKTAQELKRLKQRPIDKLLSATVSAKNGDIEALKQHLASGADVNAKADDGGTPLFWAAGYGHKEIVELLIDNAANVNGMSTIGGVPLHAAAVYGHKEIIELLIANGADVNAKGDDGTTPLDMTDDKETADLLRKHGGKTGAELKAEGK